MPEIDLSVQDSSALAALPSATNSRNGIAAASKIQIFVLAFAVILFNAVGNLSLAWGMKHVTETVGLDPLGYVRVMVNPFVAIGIMLLILWLLTRMALLSWADLSFVLPLTGLGYILAAVLGIVFLNESISSVHWLGTILIFAGTAMVGSTAQRTCGNVRTRTTPGAAQ